MEQNQFLAQPFPRGGELAKSIVALLQLLAELLKRLLTGMGNPAHRHGMLLPEEVTRMLRISDRTLRRYTEQGVLRPLRIGGMKYYLMADIIESGRMGGN